MDAEDQDDAGHQPTALAQPTPSSPSSAPSHSPRTAASARPRPPTTAEHVDALFKKWTTAVGQRIRAGGGAQPKPRVKGVEEDPPLNKDERLEIQSSVFAEFGDGDDEHGDGDKRPYSLEHGGAPMNAERFADLVEQVRLAIDAGVHPRLNSRGSSGSYFAQNIQQKTVGIFKPADEDPYSRLNPKWIKTIHRALSPVVPFGRDCLVPGTSYLAESSASILDRLLETNIVPRTEVVELSSLAFYYDWIDREKAKRGGRLRPKAGSFQVFLKGFTDGSDFLSKHPFPGRPVRPSTKRQAKDSQPKRRKRHRARGCLSTLFCICGRAGASRVLDEEEGIAADVKNEDGFEWTEEMVESFREGLECLVMLDFLIRNTDRGLDNFMLKPCHACDPPAALSSPSTSASPSTPSHSSSPHLHLAAIDNSLAFPHKHPQGWRIYPYGWLYLPLSLIGRPWSQQAKERFLPRLSDPAWWATLKVELRREWRKDEGFREDTWERQWALLKGQGWNLAESLRSENEGPVELCRRPKKLVFDEYVLVADDKVQPPPAAQPVSLGQAGEALSSPTRSTRPSLHERQSAPVAGSAPSSPFNSPLRPAKPRLPPTASPRQHRRTRSSDYATFSSRAKTTRSSSVAPPPPSDPSASAHLREPLDRLAEVPAAADAPAEEEASEETGVGLMRRLDRFEEQERKRLRRAARTDEGARRALDLGSGEDGRAAESPPSPLAVGMGRRRLSRRFRRSVSEEHARADERVPLLGSSAAAEDVNARAVQSAFTLPEAAGEGRMCMSWHGGAGLDGVAEEEEGGDGHAKGRKRWVVVERLEEVTERPRRWWQWE
ncbi:hypothetical protein JCM10207_005908 [Rhodosporidiobolus poonsookiae]